MTLAELLIAEVLACSSSMLLGYVIDLIRSRGAVRDHSHGASFSNKLHSALQRWDGP
jgi:hypothetical protein